MYARTKVPQLKSRKLPTRKELASQKSSVEHQTCHRPACTARSIKRWPLHTSKTSTKKGDEKRGGEGRKMYRDIKSSNINWEEKKAEKRTETTGIQGGRPKKDGHIRQVLFDTWSIFSFTPFAPPSCPPCFRRRRNPASAAPSCRNCGKLCEGGGGRTRPEGVMRQGDRPRHHLFSI
ncbi:hypothetical protein DL89DRAFT_131435 [Linderina pennispora]|uniref:Uncharacterized protein n=1 Tax=Linderina pennispora TaxID=61395 RepID=A0A1Y1VWP0_9FUNG|nr:uncharacterized protein DL89DRAFT_131435 [Linderina pennispora]ORX65164.1 hypothetical protein DL89DRAFT_131435 [Linderina pennispora]